MINFSILSYDQFYRINFMFTLHEYNLEFQKYFIVILVILYTL